MGENKRISLLILVMVAVGAAVAAVSIGALYLTAFEEKRADLVETVQSQARLM